MKGGDATIVGVTGSPGVGKSTLVSALIAAWREASLRVGVLAVDPSSPYGDGWSCLLLVQFSCAPGRHALDLDRTTLRARQFCRTGMSRPRRRARRSMIRSVRSMAARSWSRTAFL